MEQYHNNLLHALKIISSLQEHDKLMTKKGLYIQTKEDWKGSITRWFKEENRSSNIDALNTIFEKCFQLCFDLANQTYTDPLDIKKLKNKQVLDRLVKEIIASEKGLKNLTVTYQSDIHTVSRLMIIIENIDDTLQQIYSIQGKSKVIDEE